MFATYSDKAGGADHGFVVVAGWLSTYAKWDLFEVHWKLLLARYNLPYFHMAEFAQSTGPFLSWKGNEPKRANFLALACEVIRDCVEYGAACIVDHQSFNYVNSRYRLAESVGTPYSLAGRDCVAKFNQHLRSKHNNVLPQIDYIFDDEEGKGELRRIVVEAGYSEPIFRPSRKDQVDKKGELIKAVVPLQAADFAAYEIRKIRKDDPRNEFMWWQYRASFRALAAIRAWWGEYTESNLMRMCESVPIEPR